MLQPVPFVLSVHLVAALLALGLGAVVAVMRKGTPLHRTLGRVWVAVMVVVAVGSFWLRHGDGHLSWIHGLSAYTLFSLALAVWAIRRGKVRLHRHAMLGTFAGLSIAALFALSPGRLLGSILFG
jgi:uncharacterized membrane protein